MNYAFVKEHQAIHSIRRKCTLLAISSAGYYEWMERKQSARSIANDQLLREIVAIHKASRKTYGSPRIRAALSANGRHVNRKRISRIMRCGGIQGVMRRRFRCTTDSNHKKPVAPNHLNRAFTVPTLNTHWCGDITYVATRDGIVQSMSRKGNCWENSVSENFFGTLKSELGDHVWMTRDAARAAIFEYIEVWYNRQRLHSSNGYLSPERFEQKLAQAA